MGIFALGEARPVLPPEGNYWIAPNAVENARRFAAELRSLNS